MARSRARVKRGDDLENTEVKSVRSSVELKNEQEQVVALLLASSILLNYMLHPRVPSQSGNKRRAFVVAQILIQEIGASPYRNL